MTYTVFIKVFFGLFWKKYRVKEHDFSNGSFVAILDDGTVYCRPYYGVYKISPEYNSYLERENQAQKEAAAAKTVDSQELIKLRDQLNIELNQSQKLQAELEHLRAERQRTPEAREQLVQSRALQRFNEIVGDEHYAEAGSGRVLQGGVQSPGYLGSAQPTGHDHPGSAAYDDRRHGEQYP